MADVEYAPGLVVQWTPEQMAKIAEIKARPDRKPPQDIFVAPNHSLLKEVHREARRQHTRISDEMLLMKRLSAARARGIAIERKHNRSHAIQALLDSGMSRRQIAEALGLNYGAVVMTLWRWRKNVCQKS